MVHPKGSVTRIEKPIKDHLASRSRRIQYQLQIIQCSSLAVRKVDPVPADQKAFNPKAESNLNNLAVSETATLSLILWVECFLISGDRVLLPDSETTTLSLILWVECFLISGDRVHLPDSETIDLEWPSWAWMALILK